MHLRWNGHLGNLPELFVPEGFRYWKSEFAKESTFIGILVKPVVYMLMGWIWKRDGILGGYSLHILQPPLGGGRVRGKLRSELRKESWEFFILGGGVFLGKAGLGLWEQFQFSGGRGVLCKIPEQGCFGEIWSKFSGSLAGWCITDSLLHTTYVETNEISFLKPSWLVHHR